MNPDPLDDLLGAYAARPLPPSSAKFRAEVWAEISKRHQHSFWQRLLSVTEWRELFSEPRLIAAALALAVAAGVLPITVAYGAADSRLARASLHLDVFSVGAIHIFNRPGQ